MLAQPLAKIAEAGEVKALPIRGLARSEHPVQAHDRHFGCRAVGQVFAILQDGHDAKHDRVDGAASALRVHLGKFVFIDDFMRHFAEQAADAVGVELGFGEAAGIGGDFFGE